VTLSTAGRRFIAELRRGGKKLEREMLKTLSDTERSTLHTILLKLYGDPARRSTPLLISSAKYLICDHPEFVLYSEYAEYSQ